jgi:hypothetical protein
VISTSSITGGGSPCSRVISTLDQPGRSSCRLPGHSDMQLTRSARDLDASAAKVHVRVAP